MSCKSRQKDLRACSRRMLLKMRYQMDLEERLQHKRRQSKIEMPRQINSSSLRRNLVIRRMRQSWIFKNSLSQIRNSEPGMRNLQSNLKKPWPDQPKNQSWILRQVLLSMILESTFVNPTILSFQMTQLAPVWPQSNRKFSMMRK